MVKTCLEPPLMMRKSTIYALMSPLALMAFLFTSTNNSSIVVLEPTYQTRRKPVVTAQPKFGANWLEKEQFEEIVHNAWLLAMLNSNTEVLDASQAVGNELHTWSMGYFG